MSTLSAVFQLPPGVNLRVMPDACADVPRDATMIDATRTTYRRNLVLYLQLCTKVVPRLSSKCCTERVIIAVKR